MAYIYTVTMRDSEELVFVEETDLFSFIESNPAGQFLIFTERGGSQVALPEEDIASIVCEKEEE